jgi:hypothetical protein
MTEHRAEMKAITYTVNEHGLHEIREFLASYHKKGRDYFTRDILIAWAANVEQRISEGNHPTIEIPPRESIHGCTVEYHITSTGLDSLVVEIEK